MLPPDSSSIVHCLHCSSVHCIAIPHASRQQLSTNLTYSVKWASFCVSDSNFNPSSLLSIPSNCNCVCKQCWRTIATHEDNLHLYQFYVLSNVLHVSKSSLTNWHLFLLQAFALLNAGYSCLVQPHTVIELFVCNKTMNNLLELMTAHLTVVQPLKLW